MNSISELQNQGWKVHEEPRYWNINPQHNMGQGSKTQEKKKQRLANPYSEKKKPNKNLQELMLLIKKFHSCYPTVSASPTKTWQNASV